MPRVVNRIVGACGLNPETGLWPCATGPFRQFASYSRMTMMRCSRESLSTSQFTLTVFVQR
jgi:hypothetical protein